MMKGQLSGISFFLLSIIHPIPIHPLSPIIHLKENFKSSDI